MNKKKSLQGSDLKLIFGLKLKQLRSEKEMSLQQLADASGFAVSYLNEIEKGKNIRKQRRSLA